MSGILFFALKSGICDIVFKIYRVSKSILLAKSQNLVDTSVTQKSTWNFSLSEKSTLYLLPGKKSS